MKVMTFFFFTIIVKNWKCLNQTGPLLLTVTRPGIGILFTIDVVDKFHFSSWRCLGCDYLKL